MKPCWSCGAQDGPCFGDCECAKCVDPEGYAEWRYNNPEEYEEWLESQCGDEGFYIQAPCGQADSATNAYREYMIEYINRDKQLPLFG